MTDALLERIAFEPVGSYLKEAVAFPQGLAPVVIGNNMSPDAPLSSGTDVLVVTWTSAEWAALADVLSPGWPKNKWQTYTHNWDEFEPHLTGRSPAKEAKCLGEYSMVRIGTQKVTLFHSQLHLATDDATAPVVALWQQLISEAQPELVITTGTAGGIGAETCLGDVFIVNSVKLNCTQTFKHESWAQEHFTSAGTTDNFPTMELVQKGEELFAPFVDNLKPIATRVPTITLGGDVETVDYFAFADTDDSYGVVANDPNAHTEEMDDGTLAVAISLMQPPNTTPWVSIRNASDPQVASSIGTLEEQKQWASKIYEKYGYWTTVNSAIACWVTIAALG